MPVSSPGFAKREFPANASTLLDTLVAQRLFGHHLAGYPTTIQQMLKAG
jgi:hypothetical protein